MSENSKIEWTSHTFNPWWGCTKVHSGCANCYAETLDARWGGDHWGKNPRRMVLGEWSKPAKWDRDAREAGRIDRVFCASMCDLFEDYDGPVVDQQGGRLHITNGWMVGNVPTCPPVTVAWLRSRVFTLIHNTPQLDWLLLTKRPENVTRMVPPVWLTAWPVNVMTGTSPCNQATADDSIPHLLRVPGRRFLSCEPLLGPVDLTAAMPVPLYHCSECGNEKRSPDCGPCGTQDNTCSNAIRGVDWVIVGCESNGKLAGRFADGYEAAARDIIRQCAESGVPVFHKQMPINGRKSGDMAEWPADLRHREFPAGPVVVPA